MDITRFNMLFCYGFAIGFFYSLAAISTAIIMVRETLNGNVMTGISASIANALAQFIWATLAILVLVLLGKASILSDFGTSISVVVSALLMMFIAYKIYMTPKPSEGFQPPQVSVREVFLKMLGLNIARPIRLAVYLLFFSLIGLTQYITLEQSISIITGITIGSLCFGLLSTAAVAAIRSKITTLVVWKFSRIGAIIIFLLSLLELVKAIKS